jgi:predicted nuclease with TOPRIM domain
MSGIMDDEETRMESNGTPIRDIVIETRVDVKHIRQALDQISAIIKEHDERLREIEIEGSKLTQDNCKDVVKLQVRVTKLETGLESSAIVNNEKRHWVDSLWAKVGIGSAALFGAISIIKDYVWPLFFQKP